MLIWWTCCISWQGTCTVVLADLVLCWYGGTDVSAERVLIYLLFIAVLADLVLLSMRSTPGERAARPGLCALSEGSETMPQPGPATNKRQHHLAALEPRPRGSPRSGELQPLGPLCPSARLDRSSGCVASQFDVVWATFEAAVPPSAAHSTPKRSWLGGVCCGGGWPYCHPTGTTLFVSNHTTVPMLL